MDVDEEVARRRVKAQWQMLALIGIGLALWGSYIAVNAAFDDDTICGALGCFTIEDTDEIWLGLVMTVVGVGAAWKARRQLVG